MRMHILRWQLVAAAFAGLLFAGAAHSQAAPAGPFAKVPALPTACYTDGDPFVARIEAAHAATQAEVYKQQEINAKIQEDYQNIDPMDMAAKMQQWMMSNPQEAMKYMQTTQSMGQEAQTVAPELNAAEMAFGTEKEDLTKGYGAALTQAYAPVEARTAAMNKKLEAEAAGCGEGCLPPWAQVEWDAIQKDRDAAYRATCARWWTASGPIHDYLKRNREWLLTKYVPSWQKHDEVKLTQYAIMNTPAASWKSTVPLQEAVDYMGVARTLFALREDKPHCTPQGCDK